MDPARTRRFTLKHAIGLSTALHALLAPLFVVSGILVLGAGASLDPAGFHSDDRISMATVTLARRVEAKPLPRVLARAPALPRVVARPRAVVARQAHVVAARAGAAAVKGTTVVARTLPASSAPQPALVTSQQTPAPRPSDPAPSVQPTAAAVALASTVEPPARSVVDAPVGGWGQSFEHPLIADDNALGDLRAKYHFAAAITISVDENGRAVKINFPPVVPAEVRDDLQKRLAALHYIPAECNGLRCAALLSITL